MTAPDCASFGTANVLSATTDSSTNFARITATGYDLSGRFALSRNALLRRIIYSACVIFACIALVGCYNRTKVLSVPQVLIQEIQSTGSGKHHTRTNAGNHF